MTEAVEYTGRDNGHGYAVHTEPCQDLFDDFHVTDMKHVIKKYPKIRNIYYGWDACIGTEKPPFKVYSPMRVLNDVWKNINELEAGEYLVAADSKRILNIYVRRWLTKKRGFVVLVSGGYVNTYPYVVVQKL